MFQPRPAFQIQRMFAEKLTRYADESNVVAKERRRQMGFHVLTGLLQTRGEKGPPMLWQKEIGEGFSAPVAPAIASSCSIASAIGGRRDHADVGQHDGRNLQLAAASCFSQNRPRRVPAGGTNNAAAWMRGRAA